MIRKFLGCLLLMVAACRSLPQGTVDATDESSQRAVVAVSIWQDKIVPEANNVDSTADLVSLMAEWNDNLNKLIQSRALVQDYLNSTKGDKDAAVGYEVATNLLLDIDTNITMVFSRWAEWLNPESDKSQFIVEVNQMISDFKMLDRKFNEWVDQFRKDR